VSLRLGTESRIPGDQLRGKLRRGDTARRVLHGRGPMSPSTTSAHGALRGEFAADAAEATAAG
jgi:hypothetical protein